MRVIFCGAQIYCHLRNARYSHDERQYPRHPDLYCILHKDRKSTRLNSSHVAISYAVFCLKNKKLTNKSNFRMGGGKKIFTAYENTKKNNVKQTDRLTVINNNDYSNKKKNKLAYLNQIQNR